MICLELFVTFFEIGAFTFGGGYAMFPLIQEQVAAHGWLTQQELINFVAVSESTPGPFAINVSTYVGMETGGLPGALCATLGVVLPSVIIILAVAKFFVRFQNSSAVRGCMSGLRPAVIGLIASAVVSVGSTVFFPSGFSLAALASTRAQVSFVIFAGMLILALKKIHPILIIAVSALLGVAAGYMMAL